MSDETAQEAPAEEAAPGGLKAKLPVIAAIVVGLAVGGGSGAAFLGPMVARKMGVTTVAKPDSAAEHDSTAAEGEHGEGGEGKEGAAATPPITPLENLVLNPAGSGGSRYLLLSITVESADDAAAKALQARDAELRDLILANLGKKTVDELSDVAGREALKLELIAVVQERFGKKSVKHLYFPQWVIQ